jgi:hypothetical protein
MGHPLPAPGVHFEVTSVKKNAGTRIACGAKLGNQAPSSPLYQDKEVQSAVDSVTKQTAAVKTANDDYAKAHAAFVKARTALLLVLLLWDQAYDVLVATAQKHCATPDDGAGLGMGVRGRNKCALALPVLVTLLHDLKRSRLKIHVKRAPGMRTTVVQVQDPTNPGVWKELDGDGAVRFVDNPAPGTWSARAASKRARATSDFTTPVSLVVK